MRQLFPEPVDRVDSLTVYGDLPTAVGRPALRFNMIASVDGATAAGRSGSLGGSADTRLFSVLRSLADMVLVAAGTVRAEHYGPASVAIAVVSRSCNLDWDSRFFAAAEARPLVVTVADASGDNRRRVAEVADVVIAGTAEVDLQRALDALYERGARSVLVEGGPTLTGYLANAGLIDELCVTLAPWLVGGEAKRPVAGSRPEPPLAMELRSLCEEDGYLFLRYRSSS